MALSALESKQSGRSKAVNTAEESLRVTGLPFNDSPTFEQLEKLIFGGLTFLAEDFHAKTSATQAQAKDLTENEAVFGGSSQESFGRWDRASLSWKTSQLCLIGGLETFSERWPTAGTMRNGRVFQRAQWVQHTCDSECSLWPTPTASMDGRRFGIPMHDRSGRYKSSTVSRVQELVRENGWRIHPHFTEALMGLPLGWTAIEESEIASLQQSENGLADES